MKQKTIIIAVSLLTFLLSVGTILYPVVSNHINANYTSQIHSEYHEAITQTDNATLSAAREAAQRYNEELVSGTGYDEEGLMSASEDYEFLLNVTGDGIMGYVEIPKIQVLLPIYHGTEAQSLNRGVGHLLGSSLLVGGRNTHTILSAHSGMASQKMFTDLELLEQGDVYNLQVLGETLAYQVDHIRTVLPHDTQHLGITIGEDLATLVTCTPYGVNSHRLLVQGHRIPSEEAKVILAETESDTIPTQSTWEQKYFQGIFIGLGIIVATAIPVCWFCLRPTKEKGRYLRRDIDGRVVHAKGKLFPRYQGKFLKEDGHARIGMLIVPVFLLGAFILAQPFIYGYFTDRSIQQSATDFLNREPLTSTTELIPEDQSSLEATEPPRPHNDLWDAMVSYNEEILVQGQSGLSCEFDYQQPSFLLKDYGLDSEVFGVISIPVMELEMPIYLGASNEKMALGAVHMTQTSLPIGGANTNTVIAGHRGYSGASYFRFIEKLHEGDRVSISNIWETLNYRVREIKIINPSDVDEILIQEGRELLTLLTCHPYASGGKQRYLVICERDYTNYDWIT